MVSTYKVSPNVRIAVTGETAIVLDVRRGKFFSLSPLATKIFMNLQAGWSASEITDYFTGTTQLPRQTVEGDVQSLLAALISKGLCFKAD